MSRKWQGPESLLRNRGQREKISLSSGLSISRDGYLRGASGGSKVRSISYHFLQRGRRPRDCKPLPQREKYGRRGRWDVGYYVPHLGVQFSTFPEVFKRPPLRVEFRKGRFQVMQAAEQAAQWGWTI